MGVGGGAKAGSTNPPTRKAAKLASHWVWLAAPVNLGLHLQCHRAQAGSDGRTTLRAAHVLGAQPGRQLESKWEVALKTASGPTCAYEDADSEVRHVALGDRQRERQNTGSGQRGAGAETTGLGDRTSILNSRCSCQDMLVLCDRTLV